MKHKLLFFVLFFLLSPGLRAQDCIGAAMMTNDAYLYGRFEVAMQSAEGNGIVSSFFLYNVDLDCNWPAENNEIDIEMTGNNTDIQFTTHYPGPWYYTDDYYAGFNPHDAIHDYAIEWEPGIVRWFVDGNLVNVQDQEFVSGLIYPMRIIMNLWVSDIVEWVGPWNPSVMPVSSIYDYVRYYDYTPGNGNSGTGNNFTFSWEDDFNSLDDHTWEVAEYETFEFNRCTFKSSSIDFSGGKMYFTLEDPDPNIDPVPVTFSVDMNEETLLPSDIIYLNGTMNGWCGSCAPMTEENGIWSLTADIMPGKHEYLFTKNGWDEVGNAPMGSECDFNPCDSYANYGFLLLDEAEDLILDTYCWTECEGCTSTAVHELSPQKEAKLIGIFDLLGRPVNPERGQLLLYCYDDGRVIKQVFFGE